jgi:cellulose synthase operon protein C
MRPAVSKLLLALLSLEIIPTSSFALTGTLADLENAVADKSTPKNVKAPRLSSAEEARINDVLYQRIIKRAKDSQDPNVVNAYLGAARQVKNKQSEGSEDANDLKTRIDFYQQQIKNSPGDKHLIDSYYQLASSQDQLGDTAASAATLTEMLERFPDSKYDTEAHFRVAETSFNSKQYDIAAKNYLTVLNSGDGKYAQQAKYFYAWSLFKGGRLEDAIPLFEELIDGLRETAAGNKRDELILQDSYRALSSIFVKLGGVSALSEYYKNKTLDNQEVLIYRQVADFYREQNKHSAVAKVYENFVQRHPNDVRALDFSNAALEAYKDSGVAQDIIRSKNEYVQRYDMEQDYFKSATPEQQAILRPLLKSQLEELASHYNAVGQAQKSTADYLRATDLYSKQLALATSPADTMRIKQRIAETLYNAGKFEEAIPYFEELAYKTPNEKPSDMGYFALLSHQAHAKAIANQPASVQAEWLDKQRASSEQYAKEFPSDKNSALALLAIAGQFLDLKRFDVVGDLAARVLSLPNLSQADAKTASVMKANSDFDRQLWGEADKSYLQVLQLPNLDAAERKRYQDQRAASLYKQGEGAKTTEDLDQALKLYQQSGELSLDAAVKVDSSYQAAMLYGETPKALPFLQKFYSLYPTSPQAVGIPERIVKIQEGARDWEGASETYLKIYQRDIAQSESVKKANAMAALWLAAESQRKVSANNLKELALYRQYIKEPNASLAQSLEASERLYQAAILGNDTIAQKQELARQVEFNRTQFQSAPANVKPRLSYFAARALTLQSAPLIEEYRALALTQPLNLSVARKQALLQKVLASQQPILDLKVAEYITQSQFVLGDSFARFYQGILKTPAPTGLSDLEAEQYQITLEEQTQPLKDKAIEWHKANATLAEDAWDTWIAQSFDALSTLSSGRYLRPIKPTAIPATDVNLTRTVSNLDKNPQQVLSELDQSLAADSSAGDRDVQLIQIYRGLALLRLGKFKDAAAAFTASENAAPISTAAAKRADPAYLLGITNELYLNNQADALNAYQRYLSINPDDKTVQKWVNLLQKELKMPLTAFVKPAAAPNAASNAEAVSVSEVILAPVAGTVSDKGPLSDSSKNEPVPETGKVQ